MKIFSFLFCFVFGLFLWGCSGDSDAPGRNEKLDNLPPVGGKQNYYFDSSLECQILTGTDAQEKGTVFRLFDLDKAVPFLGFKTEDFELIEMDRVGMSQQMMGFVVISTRYGQSYLLFDQTTGVFLLSNVDIIQTGKKNTFKGNCLPLELL